MKKISLLLSYLILLIFPSISYSQTIDYTTFNTTQCNAFTPSTSISGLQHTTSCGQVKYDLVNSAIDLDENVNNYTYSGTEYKIAYNFKAKYTYTITVNATSITPSSSVPSPFLRVDFNSASNATGGFCNGPESFNNTSSIVSGNNKQINPNVFVDYTFNLLR
jgi:hypothetical protein